MYFKEAELFKGLGPGFMNALADSVETRIVPARSTVFTRGDPADYLYVLQDGRVSLYISGEGSMSFCVDEPGSVIGWSALVEPNRYTATAWVERSATLAALSRVTLEHVFERHPKEALIVMRRLTAVVGSRLVGAYQELMRQHSMQHVPSYG